MLTDGVYQGSVMGGTREEVVQLVEDLLNVACKGAIPVLSR